MPFSVHPIRKGLRALELSRKILEHWKDLGSNAVKLLTWILLSAHYSGPKRGCVEANIEDLMLGLGWSRSMVRRSLSELVSKGYVSFSGAANKLGLGTISILKFDLVEPARSTDEPSESVNPSAPLTSEPSKGRLDSTQSTSEPSRPSAKASVLTSEPSNTQESVPDVPDVPQKSKLLKSPRKYVAGELSDVARQTLRYLRFDSAPGSLTRGFVSVLDWLGKRAHLPLPGILATMILNRCLEQQRRRRSEGKSALLYAWPAGFQKWRDALRRQERLEGKAQRQAKAAA